MLSWPISEIPTRKDGPCTSMHGRAVFLHSLVGREQGLGSNIFGLTESEALLEVAFSRSDTAPSDDGAQGDQRECPIISALTRVALLCHSLDPSVNIALAKIRRSLSMDEINGLLDAFARKVVTADGPKFQSGSRRRHAGAHPRQGGAARAGHYGAERKGTGCRSHAHDRGSQPPQAIAEQCGDSGAGHGQRKGQETRSGIAFQYGAKPRSGSP